MVNIFEKGISIRKQYWILFGFIIFDEKHVSNHSDIDSKVSSF